MQSRPYDIRVLSHTCSYPHVPRSLISPLQPYSHMIMCSHLFQVRHIQLPSRKVNFQKVPHAIPLIYSVHFIIYFLGNYITQRSLMKICKSKINRFPEQLFKTYSKSLHSFRTGSWCAIQCANFKKLNNNHKTTYTFHSALRSFTAF